MSIPMIQRLVALVVSVGLLALIIQLIRTRRLREDYALIWLAAGVTIVVLSVFGGLVGWLAGLLRVSYPPTLIFVAGLLVGVVILLSQSVAGSTQADRLRDLAQALALLEENVRRSTESRELRIENEELGITNEELLMTRGGSLTPKGETSSDAVIPNS
jgi:hypothetical protein